jgi:hypothetical protein
MHRIAHRPAIAATENAISAMKHRSEKFARITMAFCATSLPRRWRVPRQLRRVRRPRFSSCGEAPVDHFDEGWITNFTRTACALHRMSGCRLALQACMPDMCKQLSVDPQTVAIRAPRNSQHFDSQRCQSKTNSGYGNRASIKRDVSRRSGPRWPFWNGD